MLAISRVLRDGKELHWTFDVFIAKIIFIAYVNLVKSLFEQYSDLKQVHKEYRTLCEWFKEHRDDGQTVIERPLTVDGEVVKDPWGQIVNIEPTGKLVTKVTEQ